MAERWAEAHPLLRIKFREPRSMPYYYARREQAAALASRIEAPSRPATGRASAMPGGAERWMASRDGRLVGRADYLDRGARSVIDYKSGRATDADAAATLSPAEGRQLRFYAHLAAENGMPVSRGVIVRADGERVETFLALEAVTQEGAEARGVLDRYASAVERAGSFEDLASPSADACAFCECMPLCGAFWRAARPSWTEACGSHVEGTVQEVASTRTHGGALVQIRLSRDRGTVNSAVVAVEQFPAEWLEVGGDGLPARGAVVRLVHARADLEWPGVLRADRALTALWLV